MVNFFELISKIEPLMTFLSTLLWGIYVLYTIKTFKEIKKQTDIQSEAYLIVECIETEGDVQNTKITESFINKLKKWREILLRNNPESVTQGKLLNLKLRNRGKTDIESWKIIITLKILPGEYLHNHLNIIGEELEYEIESDGNKDYIFAGEAITVPIGIANLFPEANYEWFIAYNDMKYKNYYKTGGDYKVTKKNMLALLPVIDQNIVSEKDTLKENAKI